MNLNTIATDTLQKKVVNPAPFVSETHFGVNGKQQEQVKPAQESGDELSSDEIKELASELNEYFDDLQTNLGFSIREEANNTVVVEIKNRQTNELIKQIPSEELLDIKIKMQEITGILFDHKV